MRNDDDVKVPTKEEYIGILTSTGRRISKRRLKKVDELYKSLEPYFENSEDKKETGATI